MSSAGAGGGSLARGAAPPRPWRHRGRRWPFRESEATGRGEQVAADDEYSNPAPRRVRGDSVPPRGRRSRQARSRRRRFPGRRYRPPGSGTLAARRRSERRTRPRTGWPGARRRRRRCPGHHRDGSAANRRPGLPEARHLRRRRLLQPRSCGWSGRPRSCRTRYPVRRQRFARCPLRRLRRTGRSCHREAVSAPRRPLSARRPR